MYMLDRVREKRDEAYRLARQHHAKRLWVFGSCARKEETPDSDVDFLVEFAPGATLFGMADLQNALRELFGRAVDLVEAKALGEDSFARRVRSEMVAL